LAADLSEERQMNDSLRKNQQEWQEKVRILQEEKDAKDREILELKARIHRGLPAAIGFILSGVVDNHLNEIIGTSPN